MYVLVFPSCLFLKSNMDRFIGYGRYVWLCLFRILKSNMDRFIARAYSYFAFKSRYFKIQYG